MMPDYSKRKWSQAQKDCRKRFGAAVKHSTMVMKDPEKKSFYGSRVKPLQHAENVAISDYLLKPKIEDIDTSKYKGEVGNTIKVTAFDKYKVTAVLVMILNANGFEVDSGMASEIHFTGSGKWVYKASKANPSWEGGSVVVKVTDYPGNVVKTFRMLYGGDELKV
ncbi:MAG: hypothetical protein ABSD71_15435 [Bacteroidales bacterium]